MFLYDASDPVSNYNDTIGFVTHMTPFSEMKLCLAAGFTLLVDLSMYSRSQIYRIAGSVGCISHDVYVDCNMRSIYHMCHSINEYMHLHFQTIEFHTERLTLYNREFERSKFYQLVKEATDISLVQAADLILSGEVDVRLTSASRSMNGWTYLHFVVNQYMVLKETDEERARLLIRAMYRLALAGIDVNARDAKGNTALIMSTAKRSQDLMNHLIRIGWFSPIFFLNPLLPNWSHCNTVRHCGLVVSAPAWDRTGCEFDSWQCRIYIYPMFI